MNVYNKTYYKFSVNLIYLTLFKEKRIKTDKTKRNKTFIKFKINRKKLSGKSMKKKHKLIYMIHLL